MDLGSSSALTIESVRLALDASSMRQRAIADNIANVNSVNHVRMRVVFEEKLAQALTAAQGSQDSDAVSMLANAQPELEAVPGPQTKVELDSEMVRLSENSLRYHALTRGLSRYFSLASAIVSGGRG
ncbi:MAG: flagellar basal body protein [Aquabacterium sp.]|uniref:flagellar basal body rod protein FlgB n=1 Tax=Aquabacterium sp. TaxID=1872578 RepID=UPI00271C870E|nr:flagellar basal body protein [Aquabacterium sp.]MDO9005742.1 flagellar basal body protein [Aquabacterium sp.]